MSDQAKQLQTAISTIVRIQKIMEPSVQTVHGELKLAPHDIQSMRFIADHPGTMSGTVADFLGVVPTTMTSIVDRLVKRGFVLRERPENNRRAVSLRLTEEGARVFGQLETEEMESSRFMLQILPEDQRDGFVHAMGQIADALTQLQDQAT